MNPFASIALVVMGMVIVAVGIILVVKRVAISSADNSIRQSLLGGRPGVAPAWLIAALGGVLSLLGLCMIVIALLFMVGALSLFP
jgi:hypothetical protein